MELTPVIVVNSIILILLTCLLAYLIADKVNLRKIVLSSFARLNEEYNERRLRREVRKYTRNVSVKMNLAEKVELYLIDKSNVRHYLPFMSFHSLLLICAAVFIAAFQPVYRILYFIPSTAVICLMFALVPVFILDLAGRYNSEKVRRRLAEFVSVLNRWCAVKEDIFYAFEKSYESGIGEPLKTFIRDMTVQVRRGIDPVEALDILQMKVDNIQFKDFIVNVKQNIKYRGDIRKLLTNLETQFYKLEEEYNRRKISTYKDRFLIFILMFCVLFVSYFFLKFNPRVREYYLTAVEGKTLLALFCLLFAGGFYFSLGITKFKH